MAAIIQRHALRDELRQLAAQHRGVRIQARDQSQARGRRANGMDDEVRTILFQKYHQAPDIPAPECRGLVALRAACIDGVAVMDEDQGAGLAQRFDIDEVPQRVLEVVHAVDESHVERLATQQRRYILPRKEVIAGLGEYLLVGRQRKADARLRVDSQRQRLRPHQLQGLATRDAHFQVGRRPHLLVYARQHLEIVLAGQLQLRRAAGRPWCSRRN